MNFGIQKLDELIGTIEEGSVILIEGLGDLSFMLAKEFLKNVINKGHKVFALVSERVKKVLGNFEGIRIITPNDQFSLQELFTISLVVKNLSEKVGVIDIFQQLLIMHDRDKIYNLLREICVHIRKKRCVGLITLDKRIVDERTLAMFENEADYVIEIEEIVEKMKITRGIRVKKSLSRAPSNYHKLYINKFINIGDEI